MDSISTQFNAQAHWSIVIAPLLVLLIIDDINRRERKKRQRLDNQFRRFGFDARKKQRQQYESQIKARCPAPHF